MNHAPPPIPSVTPPPRTSPLSPSTRFAQISSVSGNGPLKSNAPADNNGPLENNGPAENNAPVESNAAVDNNRANIKCNRSRPTNSTSQLREHKRMDLENPMSLSIRAIPASPMRLWSKMSSSAQVRPFEPARWPLCRGIVVGLATFAWLALAIAGLRSSVGAEPATDLRPPSPRPPCPWNLSALGVTRRGTPIPYWYSSDDLDRATPRLRVLVVCGGDASSAPTADRMAREIVDWFAALPEDSPGRKAVALSVVPCLLPDRRSPTTAAPPGGQSASPKPPAATAAGGPAATPEPTRQATVDSYPPQGPAYLSDAAPEAAYLWRWLGMFAPDLVVELRAGSSTGWSVGLEASEPTTAGGSTTVRPASETKDSSAVSGQPLAAHQLAAWRSLAKALSARIGGVPANSLVAALPRVVPAEVGAIPALRLTVAEPAVPAAPAATLTGGPAGERSSEKASAVTAALADLMAALPRHPALAPSPARAELRRRAERAPRAVAELLAKHYGHALPQVEYIPAVALMGRLRLAELIDRQEKTAAAPATTAGASAAVLSDLERIAAPFVDGRQSPTPKSGSGQSGHLLFVALADHLAGVPGADARRRRELYQTLAVAAAKQAFADDGRPLPAMPFHAEMSDAVFMGGPILAAAGRMTGERRYFEAGLRHFDFMAAKVVRPDGLYRHSPLDEAAWGRGNGFPALGVSLMLSEWPAAEPGRDALIAAHRRHLSALLPHQDPAGEWHQVIDRPESYRELTATCMITFSLLRGMRLGWLDRSAYAPAAERGWRAILTRIADDGRLVDVCTGTGKQTSLRAYYDREALLGRDPRGGAMALLVATERLAFVE